MLSPVECQPSESRGFGGTLEQSTRRLLHTWVQVMRCLSCCTSTPCRQATFNLQWPKGSQKRLAPHFVTTEEAEAAMAGLPAGTAPAPSPAAAKAATAAAPSTPAAGGVAESPRGVRCC